MNKNMALSLSLLCIVFIGFSTIASTQDDKQTAIKKTYTNSLHYTGSGMKYWYSKEQGGVEKILDVPYEQLDCSNCHDKSCDSCHEKTESEKGEIVLETVKPDSSCLECHFVESGELSKLNQENSPVDVHFEKGMKCMDCHTSREMHGDGKQYDSFQQSGAMDTRCENCHTELTGMESHQVHGKKLSCNACHLRNIPTCYNCHFDPETKQGNSVSPQLNGMLYLVNHKDQVTAANLHTFVANDKAMIVFSPFFSHTIMKEGRTCTDCHDNEILHDIKQNNFYPVKWENGELQNVKGVIPVLEKMKWNFVYLKNEDEKWQPLEDLDAIELNYSGFCSPLTNEQLNKLEKEIADKDIPPVSFEKSAQVFEPNRTFQAGLADLDGDGDLDVVLPNRAKIHSQVLINDGNGYFTDSGQKLAEQTHGMGIGDWDNDGDPDIVFTCAGYGENDIYTYLPTKVYLNDGKAGFSETGQDFGDDAEDLGGYVIDVSDIDSDGDLDFVKSFFRDPAKIYLNDGRGWFSESGITLPKNSILGDLDGDDDHDAFVKVEGIGYSVLLNDGTGNFVEHWTGEDSQAIAVVRGMDVTLGDLDGDGDLDAFVTNGDRERSYPATVWINDGTGRFTNSGQQLCLTTQGWVALGDLNGDGFVDAYISNMGSPNQIWLNDGTGRFNDSGLRFETDGETRGCSLGDLDGDGDLDIFVATFYGGCNEIWFNTQK